MSAEVTLEINDHGFWGTIRYGADDHWVERYTGDDCVPPRECCEHDARSSALIRYDSNGVAFRWRENMIRRHKDGKRTRTDITVIQAVPLVPQTSEAEDFRQLVLSCRRNRQKFVPWMYVLGNKLGIDIDSL